LARLFSCAGCETGCHYRSWVVSGARPRNVRFTPESGHLLTELACPPCAKSGHTEGTAVSRWTIAMFTPCKERHRAVSACPARHFRAGYHSRTIEGDHRNDDTEGG